MEKDTMVPGPDPGACPVCGTWRKTGMVHGCWPNERDIEAAARMLQEARRYEVDLRKLADE